MQKDKISKKRKIKKKYFRWFIYILYIFSLVTLGFLFFLDVVPTIYFTIITGLIIAFDLIMTLFILGGGFKRRIFGVFFSTGAMVIMGFISSYSFSTIDFLNNINSKNYNTKNYSVVVLKSSNYEKVKELKNEDIGYVSKEEEKGIEEAKNYLNKKVNVDLISHEDVSVLLNDFLNEEVEAILIEDAEKKILEEENEDFLDKEKVIYSFSIDIEIKDDLSKDVDTSKQPFNVFISGIDTYGKITSVSRSDVNMIITVNPETHKILLTSIPRDYYVSLHGINSSYKDKLTHAGIHGIDMSVKTVEDLLDIDINYYAKVNFTSLVSLVDELGGIEVDTDEAFRAYYIEDEVVNYLFKKGINKLNGKQALAYSRERKSLALGDIARNKHQQQVLEAIINKVLSKNIIVKYNDILESFEGKFVTNMGTKNITKLVKNQIKDMPTWTIESNTLTGENASNYTYSYKNTKSYVMVPDEESVNNAKNLINSVLENNIN